MVPDTPMTSASTNAISQMTSNQAASLNEENKSDEITLKGRFEIGLQLPGKPNLFECFDKINPNQKCVIKISDNNYSIKNEIESLLEIKYKEVND